MSFTVSLDGLLTSWELRPLRKRLAKAPASPGPYPIQSCDRDALWSRRWHVRALGLMSGASTQVRVPARELGQCSALTLNGSRVWKYFHNSPGGDLYRHSKRLSRPLPGFALPSFQVLSSAGLLLRRRKLPTISNVPSYDFQCTHIMVI